MYQIIDDFVDYFPGSLLAYHGYETIEKVIVKVGLDQLLSTKHLSVEIQVMVFNPSAGIRYSDTIHIIVEYNYLLSQIDTIIEERGFNMVRLTKNNQL